MKMSKRAVTFLAASAALLSQGVLAASVAAPVKLTQVQGDVMVNNGSRFVKAVSGLELKPGAKIVTAKSSNVSLVYQNGCVKHLSQNSMLTVGTAEQCAANAGKERIYVATAVGDTQTDAQEGAAIITKGESSGGPFLGAGFGYVLGGAGATAAAVSYNNGDSNKNNASPQ